MLEYQNAFVAILTHSPVCNGQYVTEQQMDDSSLGADRSISDCNE